MAITTVSTGERVAVACSMAASAVAVSISPARTNSAAIACSRRWSRSMLAGTFCRSAPPAERLSKACQ
jgi:hypothetical protein